MAWVDIREIPKDAKVGYCFVLGEGESSPWDSNVILGEGRTWQEDQGAPVFASHIASDIGIVERLMLPGCSALCTVRSWGTGGMEFIHIDSIVDLRMVNMLHHGYYQGVELLNDALNTIDDLMEALEARDTQVTTIVDNEGKSRPGTCQYFWARLYLGEPHRGAENGYPACPMLSHPSTFKKLKKEEP